MRYLVPAGLIVLLAFLCNPDHFAPRNSNRGRVAGLQIANFRTALEAYRRDVGDYPSTAEGLAALRVNPGRPGWDGPYLPQDIPPDPWGRDYVYVYAGDEPQISANRAAGRLRQYAAGH